VAEASSDGRLMRMVAGKRMIVVVENVKKQN
jgi:hypothetical protein